MARKTEGAVYRAVMEWEWTPTRNNSYMGYVAGEKRVDKQVEGPYDTIGAARSRLTWMRRSKRTYNDVFILDEYVEVADNWTRV